MRRCLLKFDKEDVRFRVADVFARMSLRRKPPSQSGLELQIVANGSWR